MQTYDHIIIGGGIIGASIAWHLSQYANQSVILIERNDIASAASSLAAGLMLQVTSKKANTPLAVLTRTTISVLEEELGQSIGYHESGSLRIAENDLHFDHLNSLREEARTFGVPAEVLTPTSAQQKVPWLNLTDTAKTVNFPTDGYIDPYLFTMAYAKAARKRGATLQSRCAVEKILCEKDAVIGVSTTMGNIYAANVIDAAGAWSAVLSDEIGVRLPLAPVRSHYWITDSKIAYGGEHPVTLLLDANTYTRPETGGLLIGIQEAQSVAFDARKLPSETSSFAMSNNEDSWDALVEGSESIARFFPDILQAQFRNYVAGLSTYTPDGHLVAGEMPTIKGLFAASGCCGSGVMLSAGIGKMISSLVLGETPEFDISAFRPDRFGCIDPFSDSFLYSCAEARSNKATSSFTK